MKKRKYTLIMGGNPIADMLLIDLLVLFLPIGSIMRAHRVVREF